VSAYPIITFSSHIVGYTFTFTWYCRRMGGLWVYHLYTHVSWVQEWLGALPSHGYLVGLHHTTLKTAWYMHSLLPVCPCW